MIESIVIKINSTGGSIPPVTQAPPSGKIELIMEKKIEFIKLRIDHLVKEPTACNGRDRYSHPAWTRKLPKWLTPCDYSKTEKLIEVEYKSGDREWFSLELFFGKVIAEVNDIFIQYPGDQTETMSIVGIDIIKVKRTTYWKLIFERDMPF